MNRVLGYRSVGFGIDIGPIHVSTEHGVSIENPGHFASHLVADMAKGVSDFVKDPIGTTGKVLASAKTFAEGAMHEAAGALSLIPGVGTGLSSIIETGLAALDGGSPLDIAIHAAYGAIPIPPGVKEVTDRVLGTILAFADSIMAGHPLTDASIAAVTAQLPKEPALVRSVADSLLHLVVSALTKHPTTKTFAQVKQAKVTAPAPKSPQRPPVARSVVTPRRAPPRAAAPRAPMPRVILPPPGSPGAPPGASRWTCTPGPGGTWACHWV